ncbi:Hsp70 family protein [Dactylosporangium sp. AC04546]|uniref:Hsp70 family protein n=1 Tax=Dactylosporangium sp. AC04546 TaxID=2862460 RepID=UPI002E7B5268|nr:Hsp70 family protein [Dactylosporangium sp. AC04546]WVK80803.1 Hsp70 family protein [Dactylosporangium sp. AC04546]
MADLHLGIDYGTSNTVAVLRWPDGRSRPLLFDSSPLLPSAVFAAADGRLLVGRDAERAARADPARFEPNPKRRIDELDVLLGDRAHTLTELVAAVLDRVAAEARRIAGGPAGQVTLTHPVAWGPARRRVLTDAAQRVGLPMPALLAEPVAAAAYFTTVLGNRVAVGQSVVVYDLGAGTFDVSVVQRTADGFETLAYRGFDDIGGLDLDALVVAHVGARLAGSAPQEWRTLDDPADADGGRHRLQLWQDAREAREILTRESSATVYVAAARRDVIITRHEFEQAATDVLHRTVQTTLATVREARVRPDSVAGWFLVGGATRTPLVATMLHRATGQPATVIEEPQLVVADGAVHTNPATLHIQPPPDPTGHPHQPPATEPATTPDTTTIPVDPPEHPAPDTAPAPRPDETASPARAEPAPAAAGPAPAAAPTRRAVMPQPDARSMLNTAEQRAAEAKPPTRRRRTRTLVIAAIGIVGVVATAIGVIPTLTDHDQSNSSSSGPPAFGGALSSRTLGHDHDIESAHLSPDGRWVATIDKPANPAAAQTAVIWNAATGASTVTFETDSGATFSPDGTIVASATFTGKREVATAGGTPMGVLSGGGVTVELRDTATGKVLASLAGHEGSAYVAFSPDGKTVATASTLASGDPFDAPVRIWDATNGTLLATLANRSDGIQSMAFSGDGKVLVSAAAGGVVKIWDVPARKAVATLDNAWFPVWISADGSTVANRRPSSEGGFELRGVPDGRLLTSVGNAGTFAGFSPDSKTYATNSAGTVQLYDLATRKMRAALTVPIQGDVVFGPDGKLIAAVDKDGVPALFDAASGQGLMELSGPSGTYTDLVFSPDGRLLLATGTDKTVRTWYVSR